MYEARTKEENQRGAGGQIPMPRVFEGPTKGDFRNRQQERMRNSFVSISGQLLLPD